MTDTIRSMYDVCTKMEHKNGVVRTVNFNGETSVLYIYGSNFCYCKCD